MKRHIFSFFLTALTYPMWAQSSTNSPYSQYGLGLLSDQSQSFSRGMNGIGQGLRKGNVVNTLNPASYSAVDSMTMLFDISLSGQLTNFKEGNNKVNAKNSSFNHFVGSFRLLKGLGAAFGIMPFSTVGYEYTSTIASSSSASSASQTFSGTGGLRQAFIGLGGKITDQLSLGANLAYLWGDIDRVASSPTTAYINSLSRNYSASVTNYKADVGAQWVQQIDKNQQLIVGATVGIGHKLGCDAECSTIETSASGTRDTTALVASNGLEIPMSYSIGATWVKGNVLTLGADLSLQAWGNTKIPTYNEQTNLYEPASGIMKNRWSFNAGADFVPEATSRKYLKRVHYKIGAGFATPYYNINSDNGPSELSISAGFGLPIQNGYNNRSVLNVSAQWVHSSAKDFITENTFRINVGITFNERWFFKWKVD